MKKQSQHFLCWMCHYKNHTVSDGSDGLPLLHISESYLRVNGIGQLVLVCESHKDTLVDPMVIRKFRKMFNLSKKS